MQATAIEAITELQGTVTSPVGFLAGAVACGIKRSNLDLALLVSERPATAAGVFTTNRVAAAPVLVCRERVASGAGQAIVANSGSANACTGEPGVADAREMAALAGAALGLDPALVYVASTGVIGMPLPMDAIRAGIPQAARALGRDGEGAARAIMTTDAFPKTAAAAIEIGGRLVTVGGIAKGAGMIHPQMATTLCFLTTDASVPAPVLDAALRRAIDASFNSITVDGDTSTNDTALLFANGAAGGAPITEGEDLERFEAALGSVARRLALMLVRDGEGASRVAEIRVTGAASDDEAKRGAYTVAHSPLVKTMLYGAEPNWGRVVAALGRAGIALDERRVAVWFGDVQIVAGGLAVPDAAAAAAEALRQPEVVITADLGVGAGRAVVWTCDLNERYVQINGSYIS